MSFVHNTALLMTVRSAIVICDLQVFSGIFVTLVLGVSQRKWHVFHITVLKIIYVYNNDDTCVYMKHIHDLRVKD